MRLVLSSTLLSIHCTHFNDKCENCILTSVKGVIVEVYYSENWRNHLRRRFVPFCINSSIVFERAIALNILWFLYAEVITWRHLLLDLVFQLFCMSLFISEFTHCDVKSLHLKDNFVALRLTISALLNIFHFFSLSLLGPQHIPPLW